MFFVIYDTTAAISRAGTVYPPGAPEFIIGFYWVSCCSCLPIKCFQLMGSPPIYCMIRFDSGLCIFLCLVIHLLLANVLYVLRITISNHPFGILNFGRYSESVLMPCSSTYILVVYYNLENGSHFLPFVLQFPFIISVHLHTLF
jgi:hypothetical protein